MKGSTDFHSYEVKQGCSAVSKFWCKWLVLRVLKIVDTIVSLGRDRTNCKCFAELFFILFRISDLKGTFATLPWYSGQQKFIFTWAYSAILNKVS